MSDSATIKSDTPFEDEDGDAGLDLPILHDVFVQYGFKTYEATLPIMCIEDGFYGELRVRSSYAKQYGLEVLGGIIDANYAKPITLLFRCSVPCMFNSGARLVQLIIHKKIKSVCAPISTFEIENSRLGFGSTGMSGVKRTKRVNKILDDE